MTQASILNISAYRFVNIEAATLPQLKQTLLAAAKENELKGTILLSTEGINLFIAGLPTQIRSFFTILDQYTDFRDLPRKESYSSHQPFTRMLVRIKKEIISMGRPEVVPAQKTAPHLSPQQLHQWYSENKDMVVLDTRNDYEVALGTFKDAIDLNIDTFRAFPDAVQELPAAYKDKPVVTFCTGGIRCEKAAEYMLQLGFKEVYQLDGGILNYFEQQQGEHYEGECFVFDKRVAVNAQLDETDTTQCYACRMPLVATADIISTCPHCQGNPETGQKPTTEQMI